MSCSSSGSSGLTSSSRGFFVDLEEPVELHHAAGCAEHVILCGNLDGGLIVDRRIHLRSDEPRPDQPVELVFVFGQDTAFRSSGVRPTNVGRMAS